VLVGEETAYRRWVKYEIIESWNSRKGVVGIRKHNLADSSGKTSAAGPNPFDNLTVGTNRMSSIVKLHNPSGSNSTEVYASISDNIEQWVS
jgi:hypothetical protein